MATKKKLPSTDIVVTTNDSITTELSEVQTIPPPQRRLPQHIARQLPSGVAEAVETLTRRIDLSWVQHDKEAQVLAFALGRYQTCRFVLGELLTEVKAMLAIPGRGGLFTKYLDAVGYKRGTAYDLISDYDRVKNLPKALIDAASKRGVDITAKRYSEALWLLEAAGPIDPEKALADVLKVTKKGSRAKKQAGSAPKSQYTQDQLIVYQIFSACERSLKVQVKSKQLALIKEALSFVAHYVFQVETLDEVQAAKAPDDWILSPSHSTVGGANEEAI